MSTRTFRATRHLHHQNQRSPVRPFVLAPGANITLPDDPAAIAELQCLIDAGHLVEVDAEGDEIAPRKPARSKTKAAPAETPEAEGGEETEQDEEDAPTAAPASSAAPRRARGGGRR